MENQEHFGRLTDRMATFREEVLEEKPYIDAERAVLATQAYKRESKSATSDGSRAYVTKDFRKHEHLY